MRLAFLGTPEFACPTLRALRRAGHEISCVVTQPDRPRGRGQKIVLGPVRQLALELGLESWTLEPGQRSQLYQRILATQPDLAVVIAFGHIVREPLLHGPRLGCVNLHASLLPRWRGAAPIQRAIVAGDRVSGVSLMQLDAGLDTGPLLATVSTPIAAEETAEALQSRLADLAAELLLEQLPGIAARTLTARAQDEVGISYAPMLHKREGSADPTRPAAEIAARIRGLFPWPGVTMLHGGQRLKLLEATSSAQDFGSLPGQLRLASDGTPMLQCGLGSLRLSRVQAEGRAAMSGADYWRGVGSRLGEELKALPDFQPQARG